MMMNTQIKHIRILAAALLLCACHNDWFDIKADKSIVVPASLDDLQALLENGQVDPVDRYTSYIAEAGTNDYYLPTLADWQAPNMSNSLRNVYIWQKDQLFDPNDTQTGWQAGYKRVAYCNVVLEGLKNITMGPANRLNYQTILGSALFYRAHEYYQLAQVFAPPYDPQTSGTDLGIVLRNTSDPNVVSVRASVRQTYDQITADLEQAVELLPEKVSYKTRPSKATALALLSRTWLAMRSYDQALEAAEQSLGHDGRLIDFNELDPFAAYPVPPLNDEILFHSAMNTMGFMPHNSGRGLVYDQIYETYIQGDLRKALFFFNNGTAGIKYKGTFTGRNQLFAGIATDEVYLTAAECHARAGNTGMALARLNTLLEKRWRREDFTPLTAASADDALLQILAERKKELLYRGIRWMDLRRLNAEPRFAETLTRTLDGVTYTLQPGDSRYTYPLPQVVVDMTGLAQNIR